MKFSFRTTALANGSDSKRQKIDAANDGSLRAVMRKYYFSLVMPSL